MIDYNVLEKYAKAYPDRCEMTNSDGEKVTFRVVVLHTKAVRFLADVLDIPAETFKILDLRPGLTDDVLQYAVVPLFQVLWDDDIPEDAIDVSLHDDGRKSAAKIVADIPLNIVYIAFMIDLAYATYSLEGERREEQIKGMLSALHEAMSYQRQERDIREMFVNGNGLDSLKNILAFADEGPDDGQVMN